MKGMKQGKVFIQGNWIALDEEEINSVIGCLNNEEDDFVKIMSEGVNIT